MTPLFRREAIEAHRQQWMGEVRLVRPVSMSVLVAVLVAVAIAVGCWLVLGEYTRKAHVRGVLVPDRGWIRLVTPQLATVAERRVTQGQAVRAGDVLFVLSLDQHVGDGSAQQRVQRSLRARQESLSETLEARQRLSREQETALTERLAGLRQETAQIATEIELQRQRLALSQQTLARLESLREERFVSSAQINTKSEEVLALRAQLRRAGAPAQHVDARHRCAGRPAPRAAAAGTRARRRAAARGAGAGAGVGGERGQARDADPRAAGRHAGRGVGRARTERDARCRPWRAWCRPTRGCRRTCTRRRARSGSSGRSSRCGCAWPPSRIRSSVTRRAR